MTKIDCTERGEIDLPHNVCICTTLIRWLMRVRVLYLSAGREEAGTGDQEGVSDFVRQAECGDARPSNVRQLDSNDKSSEPG